ncbi:MAG: hypothetical protein AB7U45_03240 [Desulfamplus sp.]
MELDKINFFRRIIVPWYDSYPVCWILVLWSLFVLLFAFAGIDAAITNESFADYVWFPTMLATLAFLLILSLLFRMIHRNLNR